MHQASDHVLVLSSFNQPLPGLEIPAHVIDVRTLDGLFNIIAIGNIMEFRDGWALLCNAGHYISDLFSGPLLYAWHVRVLVSIVARYLMTF